MGGDRGPAVVLDGLARIAAGGEGDIRFLLHGDQAVLTPLLGGMTRLASASEIRHAASAIAMDAKPAHAMRRGKGSSMWNAVETVRVGEAAAAVSAGNTGALMAVSRLILRMAGDLDRPALVASWPTARGVTAVLDVGANVVCDAGRLVDFAILGAAFFRAAHAASLGGRPSVGLLNVGTETEKGHQEVRDADHLLRGGGFDFDYHGFVEGDDIARGTVDVVVTDGFTGNVALKTAEGLARYFRDALRTALTSGVRARLGAAMARPALTALAARLDPGGINGGPFLGLKGVVVKSHGGADAAGTATAVRLAIGLARNDIAGMIERRLAARAPSAPALPAGA